VSTLAPSKAYGRAFGVERAGDNLGAVVGPLGAAGLVRWIRIRPTICCAAIPGVLAAVAITVAAVQARRLPVPERRRSALQLRQLGQAGFTRPMLPIIFFKFRHPL
jgi:hypothetical protein